MGKRGNGEGGIHHRSSDKKWVARYRLPNYLGGKNKYHYADSRKECVIWLENLKYSILEGTYSSSSDITLLEWSRIWLKDYSANVIKPSTHMNYNTYIEKHIAKSNLANMPLNQVSTHALQTFFNNLSVNGRLDEKGGLSAKTIRNIYNMTHKMLAQAVGNKLIVRNNSDYVVLPKVEDHKIDFLDMPAQNKLIAAANGERWKISLEILLGTGLRLGELLALHVSDFKCEDEIYYLDISKTLQRVTDYDGETDNHKTVLHESTPKTSNSRRQVVLSPALADLVKSHIEKLQTEANNSYGFYQTDPFIIGNELGKMIDQSTYRKWFKRVVEKAGLRGKITPHTCRHSFSSIAAKYLGIRDVADTLGHSDPAFTSRVYVHSDLKGRYSAMCELEQRIKAVKGSETHDS